jgi:cadmium resistance protein CadD (predicted permease)
VESLLALSLATYAGTALDNLLMLTVLRAAGTRSRDVVTGFLGGSAIVLAICAAGTALSEFMPAHYIGYLGVVPIGLGAAGLVGAIWQRSGASVEQRQSDAGGIAALQVASSLDSVAAFLPLFADTERPYGLVIAGGFTAMTLAWLAISRALAGIPGVAA